MCLLPFRRAPVVVAQKPEVSLEAIYISKVLALEVEIHLPEHGAVAKQVALVRLVFQHLLLVLFEIGREVRMKHIRCVYKYINIENVYLYKSIYKSS